MASAYTSEEIRQDEAASLSSGAEDAAMPYEAPLLSHEAPLAQGVAPRQTSAPNTMQKLSDRFKLTRRKKAVSVSYASMRSTGGADSDDTSVAKKPSRPSASHLKMDLATSPPSAPTLGSESRQDDFLDGVSMRSSASPFAPSVDPGAEAGSQDFKTPSSRVHNFNPTSLPTRPLSKLLVPFNMMKPLVPQSASKAAAKVMSGPAAATRGLVNMLGPKREGAPPAGYVWLWMGGFLRWRRRFIVASPEAPGVVMIYKHTNLNKGKILSVSLRNATVDADDADPRLINVITHSKGKIFLKTVDEAERGQWVVCLHESIRLYQEKQRVVDNLREQGLLCQDSDADVGLGRSQVRRTVKLVEVADMDSMQRRQIRTLMAERMAAVVPYQQEAERHMAALTSNLLGVVSGLNIRLPAMSSPYSGTNLRLQPAMGSVYSAASQPPHLLGRDGGGLARATSSGPLPSEITEDVAKCVAPQQGSVSDGDDEGDVKARIQGASISGARVSYATTALPVVPASGSSRFADDEPSSPRRDVPSSPSGFQKLFSRSRTRCVNSPNLQQAYSQLLEELRSIIHADAVQIVQLEAENLALQKTLQVVKVKEKARARRGAATAPDFVASRLAGESSDILNEFDESDESDASAATADEDAFDVDDAFAADEVALGRTSAAVPAAGGKKKRLLSSRGAPAAPMVGVVGLDDGEGDPEEEQRKAVINALAAVRQVEYVEKRQQEAQLCEIMSSQAPPKVDLDAESADDDDDDDDVDSSGRFPGAERKGTGGGADSELYNIKADADGNILPPPLPGTLADRPLRTRLPAPKPLGRGFSVWTILKNMIGKDLSKITMPATINEPTSFLQRLTEAYEYSALLDCAAADEPDSVTRMMLVSVWVLSCYNSQALRLGKPFNPLLGETYEWQSNDCSVRFVSEQVSHHPPVSAYHAEGCGGAWTASGEFETKTKFWGKSIEAILHGCEGINFKNHNEEYRFNKAIVCVHDLIFGKFWVEVYGKITVTNTATGDSAVLNIKPCNGKMIDRGNFDGKVFDAKGKEVYTLSGNILTKIDVALTKTAAAARGGSTNPVQMWEKLPNPEDFEEQYNFTQMTIGLNDPGDPIAPYLPPTDARFRTDQMAMELGEWTTATSEKLRLEEKQRVARRILKEKGLEYKPMWFAKVDPGSKELVKQAKDNGFAWAFTQQYWQRRKQVDWNGCMDLYSNDSPQ